MKLYQKLQFKLSAIIVLSILIPLVIVGAILLNNAINEIENGVYSLNKQLAEGIEKEIKVHLSSLENTMRLLSNSDSVRNMDAVRMDALLQDVVVQYPLLNQLYVIDETGMQIYKTSGELGDR